MDWIMGHKQDLLLAFTTAVTLFSVIAKMTPSEWDDKLVGKLLRILSINK